MRHVTEKPQESRGYVRPRILPGPAILQERRLEESARDLPAARERAEHYGIKLAKVSETMYLANGTHYKLGEWSVDIHPATQRVIKSTMSMPYLRLPRPWSLSDVIEAMVKIAAYRNGGRKP